MKLFTLFVSIFVLQASFAQELASFSLSSCSEKSYPEYIRHRIVSKEMKEDTLTVRLGLVLNCCVDPEPNVTFWNNSIIVQIDNVADLICMCECCFEIELKLTGITDEDFKVIYNKDDVISNQDLSLSDASYELEEHSRKYVFPSPTELEEAENYSSEMNQFTEDGQEIGLWKKNGESNYYLLNYILSKNGKTRRDWYACYNPEGELVSIGGNDGLGSYQSAEPRSYYLVFGIDILKK